MLRLDGGVAVDRDVHRLALLPDGEADGLAGDRLLVGVGDRGRPVSGGLMQPVMQTVVEEICERGGGDGHGETT